jgi:hypothetical protein
MILGFNQNNFWAKFDTSKSDSEQLLFRNRTADNGSVELYTIDEVLQKFQRVSGICFTFSNEHMIIVRR